jgi:DNA-directed RNA polymerase|tara:strand:+ start:1579 stop:4029 length:2451 start_codon:yes stop_codon:yes gene_type:complete
MTKLLEIMPTFPDQNQNEKDMAELGKQRTNKRRVSHVEREEESVTSYGKVMVANTIRPLAKRIKDYLEDCAEKSKTAGQPPVAFMHLSGVDPEISALITAKHIINTITQYKPLTATCISLGGKIETEEQLKNFQYLNPELYEVVKMDLDKRSWNYAYKRRKLRETAKRGEVAWTEWTTPQKLHVGIRLVEMMIEATGLIEIGTETINRKKTKIIKQTQKTREWIQNRNSFNELLNPEYLPCVMPPKQWSGVSGGGYWTKELPELDLVKQRNKKFKVELESFKMPEVYNAVNVMQNSAFKVNHYILGVMQEAWDKGLALGGMPPNENHDIPNKPHDIDTNREARKEWKKKAVIAHTENARMFSKRLLYAKILWEADKFKSYKTIYFPLQLDFRGRAYCVPAFLNYQSISGAKALLKFSYGKAITKENKGDFWLAVHGANMWGKDKQSLQDRVKWVEQNQDMIINCALDPFTNRQWEDASSPFQALAFCEEWRQFKEQGYGFESSIPVSIDGSCNGLQLYSLMLRDEHAGKLVNVVPADEPQDIYQLVADAVTEKLKEDAKADKPYAQKWLDYGVKRSTTKRSIMTICYGSTRYSCTDFVVEDLTKRKDKGEMHPFIDDVFRPASYLAGVIWDSIGDNLTSARLGMDYLQSIARLVSKEQLPIHWITPIGFPVYQSYPEMKSKRVKAMLMGEVIKPRINTETDKTDKLRMSNGIAPNLVHSVDSACMMKTVNIAYERGIKNFCNVHDSFGTTAADVETLSASLKEAFIEIFTKHDVLKDFRDDVFHQLPEALRSKLPEVPEKGNLDIERLRDCDFFFA